MRIIIAGGRDFVATPEHERWLDDTIGDIVTEVVSGAARGADTFGEHWAKERSVPVKLFPAFWRVYGRSAGHRRNRQMAEYAEGLVAFPGGKGTESMIRYAKQRGLRVWLWSQPTLPTTS